MKLSVETKVGAAIAAGFIGLTLGAVAQGNWEGQTGELNSYGPTNNPKVNTYKPAEIQGLFTAIAID